MSPRKSRVSYPGFVAALFLTLAAASAGAWLFGAAPPAADGVTVGRNDAPTATANRQWIEGQLAGGAVVTLPAGVVHVDRGLRLPSGSTLIGQGADRTRLVNSVTGAPFGDNCTLNLQPPTPPVGYADGWTGLSADRRSCAISGDLARYGAGATVYAWQWDGYDNKPGGQSRQRLTVTATDPAAKRVTFDQPLGPTAGALKWVAGPACDDLPEGATVARVRRGPAGVAVGDRVFVTDGPSLANEARGEWRAVVAVDALAVTLDRPLRRAYTLPALAVGPPLAGITVRDLTVALPANGQSQPLFAKFATGLRFDRVRFGGVAEFTSSADVLLTDCSATDALKLNGAHDVEVRGGRWQNVYAEEGAFDVTLDGLRVGPCPVNGITTTLGCERFSVRRCRIEGVRNVPLSSAGLGNVVQDVDVIRGGAPCYLSGDGLRVSGLRADVEVMVQSGTGQSLAQVRAPLLSLGWPGAGMGPSGGAAVDCAPVRVLGGKWNVWP
jgi:hypothetical protein